MKEEVNRRRKTKEVKQHTSNQCNQTLYPQSISSKHIVFEYNPNKEKKLKIDGKTFKNNYNGKRDYLEKYNFHKMLLYLKKYERETSTLRLPPSNIQRQVEDFF